MPRYEMVQVEETPYLYEERSCSMDPQDVGANMAEAFRTVDAFVRENGITSAKDVLSAYYTYDPERIIFRAGVSVSAEDAKSQSGSVKADVLPAGEVLHFTHVGPYSTLRDSYGEMMDYLAENKLNVGAPTWEVYVDDPAAGIPEEELRTEVYVTLA